MASTVKKHFSRLNQALSQSIGRSEKSEVISEDLQNVDQRVELMVNGLKHTKKKLVECLRSRKTGSTKEDAEKRKQAFEEYKLAQTVLSEAKNMDALYSGNLLSDVMQSYGDALSAVVHEMVKYEMHTEQNVLEKLSKYNEDFESVCQQKDKLKKLVLDMDSAKSKLNAAQSRGDDRINESQDEFDAAYGKVESFKDAFAVDLYTLASKEVELAGLFKTVLQIQIDYHRNALSRLETVEPVISRKIDLYPRRPVYGCPLEDHLKYSGREIAIVLEVCCTGLVDLGLKDEGVFRIPGNATKLRKLKAGFDAGEIDLADFCRDPHSLAGALKLYLRELPDPLMAGACYDDWMKAVDISDQQSRLHALRDVVSKLPPANYTNLRYLIKFLSKLLEYQAHTKMSSQNLAIVMAPNMIWSPSEGEGYSLNSSHGLLVELLVVNANFFFPGDIQFRNLFFGGSEHPVENGGTRRQDSLFVDVSSGGSASATDDSLATDKQISPSKGGPKKSKPAPPPPSNGIANASPTSAKVDQRSVRASYHGPQSDRVLTTKEIAQENVIVVSSRPFQSASTASSGHKKSNSLDRLSVPQWSLAPESNTPGLDSDHSSSGKSIVEPSEQQLSTSTSELGYSNIPEEPETGQFLKSATLPRPQQQQRVRPPVPIRTSVLQQRPTTLGMGDSRLIGTMVEVVPSDDSDEEEPVIRETGCGGDTPKSGKMKPVASIVSTEVEVDSALSSYPTSPKEVSYVSVLEEPENVDRRLVLPKSAGTNASQPQQAVLRPKPPVPVKPRSLESPEKESIVRL